MGRIFQRPITGDIPPSLPSAWLLLGKTGWQLRSYRFFFPPAVQCFYSLYSILCDILNTPRYTRYSAIDSPRGVFCVLPAAALALFYRAILDVSIWNGLILSDGLGMTLECMTLYYFYFSFKDRKGLCSSRCFFASVFHCQNQCHIPPPCRCRYLFALSSEGQETNRCHHGCFCRGCCRRCSLYSRDGCAPRAQR